MGAMRNLDCIEILLVEDNPADVELTRIALEEGHLLNNLHVVNDGMEALAFLKKQGKYEGKPRPDLILLDLNLPRVDGREVLHDIKADESLSAIPVLVLTSSSAEEDILRSYKMHANSFISKPVDLDQFISVIRSIGNYWVSIVKLPPR